MWPCQGLTLQLHHQARWEDQWGWPGNIRSNWRCWQNVCWLFGNQVHIIFLQWSTSTTIWHCFQCTLSIRVGHADFFHKRICVSVKAHWKLHIRIKPHWKIATETQLAHIHMKSHVCGIRMANSIFHRTHFSYRLFLVQVVTSWSSYVLNFVTKSNSRVVITESEKRTVYLDSKQILNMNFTHKLPRSLDKAGLYSLKLCSWSDITWERPPWLVVSEEDDSLYFVKNYWRVFFRSAMTYCTTSGGPTCPSAQKSGSQACAL